MTRLEAILAVVHGPLRGMDPAVRIELSPQDQFAFRLEQRISPTIAGLPVTAGTETVVVTKQGGRIKAP